MIGPVAAAVAARGGGLRVVGDGRAEAEHEGYRREDGEESSLHGMFHCWLELSAQAPDLDLGAGAAEAGVVEALAGVRGSRSSPLDWRHPGLRAGAVAVVQVDGGAVGGAGAR